MGRSCLYCRHVIPAVAGAVDWKSKISYAEIVDSTELIGDFGVANLCLRRINDTLTLNHTAINVEKEGKRNINYRK